MPASFERQASPQTRLLTFVNPESRWAQAGRTNLAQEGSQKTSSALLWFWLLLFLFTTNKPGCGVNTSLSPHYQWIHRHTEWGVIPPRPLNFMPSGVFSSYLQLRLTCSLASQIYEAFIFTYFCHLMKWILKFHIPVVISSVISRHETALGDNLILLRTLEWKTNREMGVVDTIASVNLFTFFYGTAVLWPSPSVMPSLHDPHPVLNCL